jgi:hypothetical protein
VGFFIFIWITLVVGFVLHVLLDRKPNRRTSRRVVELGLLWVLAGGGAWAIFGGFGHVGPNSTEIAEEIGYEPSFFQWEVGFADIAIGVLGLMCIWLRGSFMTAAVVALVILFGGDAIGHIMQWVAHDNTDPDNIWALPSDVLQSVLAAVLLVAYRRMSREHVLTAAPV